VNIWNYTQLLFFNILCVFRGKQKIQSSSESQKILEVWNLAKLLPGPEHVSWWLIRVGRGSVSEVESRRTIALSIVHLKAIRRGKKPGYSDQEIADAINEQGRKREGWQDLKKGRINAFLHGRDHTKAGALPIVLTAINAALVAEQALLSVAELDRRYRHQLPPLLNRRSSHLFEGEELGQSTADSVGGAWQFFYLSPLDRAQKKRPQYRGIGVFVHQADPTSRTVDFFVISGTSRWEGEAFINQSHLYLMCSDVGRKEAAFFLMNRPRIDQPYLAGVGAGLERHQNRSIRPALGFFCFGVRWPESVPSKAGEKKETVSSELAAVIKRAVDKESIEGHEENMLRNNFCKAYSVADLKKHFRHLYEYIQGVRINGDTGHSPKSRPWLYLEWP
jgi:hypothetical protein